MGEPCASTTACDIDLTCAGGICGCITSGTSITADQVMLCCSGIQTSASGIQCVCQGQGPGAQCMSDADCCGPGGGGCVNYKCT
jgi:hypothetical protein